MDFRWRSSADSKAERDVRPQTTSRIWLWAMVMMGPSIPMVALTRSSIVPLVIIAGAALSSVAVWAFGGRSARLDKSERAALEQSSAETARLRSQVQELEERLFALETMSSYERAAAHRATQQSTQHPSAAPFDSPFDSAPPQRDPLLPSQPAAPRRTPAGRGVSIAQD